MTGRTARLAPGDPASLGGLAAASGAAARSCERLGQLLVPERKGNESTGTRRADRDVERRVGTLRAGLGTSGRELGDVAEALRDHAARLSEAQAALRSLVDRAHLVDLVVEGRQVLVRPGIRGAADATHDRTVLAHRDGLQGELDALLRTVARRRAELVSAVVASSSRLADEAARVRRG